MSAEDTENKDKALRLFELCKAIEREAKTLRFDNASALKAAWWRTAQELPAPLGLESSFELQDTFFLLCRSTVEGIEALQLRRESLRTSWLASVSEIRGLFDATAFGMTTRDALSRSVSINHLATLDAISERFQTDGLGESPRDVLEDAFEAMREALEACEAAPGIPPILTNAIRHLLHQMETALGAYEIAGEAGFWRAYKEAYASFVQLHPFIMGVEGNQTIVDKIKVLGTKLLLPLSVSSNIVTLGAASVPLLTGG